MKDLDGMERALLAIVYLSVLVLVAAITATTVVESHLLRNLS